MEKYDNLGMVGEGSYGMVMKCRNKETGQIVAIKKFFESEDDKMVRKIAMREVRMLRKLRHENLVNLIEVFRRKKRLYLVFEFVDHTILDEIEKSPCGLSEMTVRKTLWQILRGLEFCHSHNIIHRDIKPENILNSKDGVIKLCDFGFARTLASTGEIYTDYVATRWYRAPELLVGDTKYGRAVDIWAIGCLVGEMLQGDPIFPGKSDIDQLSKILNCVGNLCPRHKEIFQRNPLFHGMRLPEVKIIQPLEKKFPGVSNEALDLMKECLCLDPNERPSASSLLRHEFFKHDDFLKRVIPDLRTKLISDSTSNFLARKEANEKRTQEKDKRQRKMTEELSNNSLEIKVSSNEDTSKKSSDSSNVMTNSLKNPEEYFSFKKTGIPKPVMNSVTNAPATEDNKTQWKGPEKGVKPSVSVTNEVPLPDHSKQGWESCPASTTELPNKSSQSISILKKSTEGSSGPSLQSSIDDSLPSMGAMILEPSPTKNPSLNLGIVAASSELNQPLQANFELVNSKSKDSEVEIDPILLDKSTKKEKQRDLNKTENRFPDVERSSTSKHLPPNEHESQDEGGKRPSKEVESFPHQSTIPPISKFQNSWKTSSPDPVLSISNSLSSSTKSKLETLSGAPTLFKGAEKVKRGLVMASKMNDVNPQGSFDRNMYHDKTSHFEKMMIAMSGATSITHSSIKKSNASPSTQIALNNPMGNIVPGGMQHMRDIRDDKSTNLPPWSSFSNDDKAVSISQSPFDNVMQSFDHKVHKHLEDIGKLRDESPKQNRRDSKNRHQASEEKQLRKLSNVAPSSDLKYDSRASWLPDLGLRSSVGQERESFPSLKLPGSEASTQKPKKSKSKSILASIPALEHGGVLRSQQRSRSPSPEGNPESNFPSVHAKH